jgi:integrase
MAKDWPPKRHKWFPGFTAHRDGWVRSYKGRTLACGGRRASREEVERTWEAKRKAVDSEATGAAANAIRTYRVVLDEFLKVQKARIGAPRNRIEERTYHNYVVALNAFGSFVHESRKTADRDIRDIGPGLFSAYARTFATWKASGFDSVVTRVSALFNWAAGQEYIDRYRPGPEFVRPAKQDIRDQRIMLGKSYTPAEVAKLWSATSPGSFLRCAVGLGVCAAFNNSDLGHVTRDVMDLASGVIDFRRRKTGKVRRVIPLPVDVLAELRAYRRPEPARGEWADNFFLTVKGQPYARSRSRGGGYKPSDSVSRLFRELRIDAGVDEVRGRNYSGLRTTAYNLWPKSGYDTERAIVMGHAKGNIPLDHYFEDVGLERLAFGVLHVWAQVASAI